jgi:glutamate dehydrogenase (NADP+)
MSQSITTLKRLLKKTQTSQNFLQAVLEVAETVIPFIEENKKYQNKMLLEEWLSLTEYFRVAWIDDKATQVNRGSVFK